MARGRGGFAGGSFVATFILVGGYLMIVSIGRGYLPMSDALIKVADTFSNAVWNEPVDEYLDHVVPMPPVLPPICNVEKYDQPKDSACYFAVQNQTLAELEADPLAPYCWGTSGLNSTPGGGPRLLFHGAALTALPVSIALYINSFLATQCCDAVLWFWLPASLMGSERLGNVTADIAASNRHRIIWKELDVAAEWDTVSGDFPDVSQANIAALSNWTDLRYITDWARLVLMYKYGGVWFDIDTVFLRDLRPLVTYPTPSFGYCGGWGLINNAAMRIAQRPEGFSHAVLSHVIKISDPRPDAIGYYITDSKIIYGTRIEGYNKAGIAMLSQTLFDFMWFRFLNIETDAMKQVHKDIVRGAPWNIVSKAWTGFFTTTYNETTSPSLSEVQSSPFLPGSFAYHWHNRYEMGLPTNSWADVLNKRFYNMSVRKACRPPPLSTPQAVR